MTDITTTAAQIGAVDPMKANIETYIAAEAITKGQAVYINTSGKVAKADANSSGKEQFRGIALRDVASGEAVEVLHDGVMYGFGVSSLNAEAKLYLSGTAGALADGAHASMTVIAGRVEVLTDGPTLTKVARIFTQWEADWS